MFAGWQDGAPSEDCGPVGGWRGTPRGPGGAGQVHHTGGLARQAGGLLSTLQGDSKSQKDFEPQ